MINNEEFLDFLISKDISFFTGVPDSLLKEICACISSKIAANNHIITANEGNAVALAAGYHLATKKIPLVYLQNSGLGNAINPLLSLADAEVYSIPMILLIGWRGEPNVNDEPQHIKQGKIQNNMLEVMQIPYAIIGPESEYRETLNYLISQAELTSGPVALIIKKGTFDKYKTIEQTAEPSLMYREEALQLILSHVDDEDIIVSTTGMASREIFEIRVNKQQGHHRDFLTVGSMGHCSQIALGIATNIPHRKVYCIDGDGSVIMHMGSLAIIGAQKQQNLKHIVINNGAHDSVGGQPTVGKEINITEIALACGYRQARRATTHSDIESGIKWLVKSEGTAILEIFVKKGNRKNLGRPTKNPKENKIDFMNHIKSTNGDLS